MAHENAEPFLGTYRESGYLFGNSAYTCCRNCGRRNNCPAEKREKCTSDNHPCGSCTRWDRRGCRYFVLDWSVLKL